jgi:hypothetical protein
VFIVKSYRTLGPETKFIVFITDLCLNNHVNHSHVTVNTVQVSPNNYTCSDGNQ